MPSSPTLHHIIKILTDHGFQQISQKGSHMKFKNSINPIKTVIVPYHKKQMPYGTFRGICQQSGIPHQLFR